ncbi:COG4223 family protein [Jannaschia seohaensis]|uniref:Inner membrane protein n=1 Tax=Jannaschia seohaensis TaxID=475081 RepID=A0A2Y9AH00_9RHOB|nr:hypothetical protein [Jannaschia seohaensis]PWJ21330.1 hypothetical protein BCF38_102582 [Jannaschia seohaensis]SSA41819.1 hypothetical protein SAMN05421539_102582 [Jannaschia seohaensis]
MARKTRKPRTTRPAPAVSETEAQTIAEAEQAEKIEDAEIVSDQEPKGSESLPDDAPILADDTIPPSEAEAASSEDVTLPADEPESETAASEPEPGEAAPTEDAAATDAEAPMGDDTVPPEEHADLADLARLDGADPEKVEAEAKAEAPEEMAEAPADAPEPERAPPAAPSPAPQPQVVEKSGPGFVPLVLGGLLAGAIGYAIPTFVSPPAPETVDPAAFAALQSRVDALPTEGDPVDLSAIETAQAELSERVDGLAARLDALEARPVTAAEQASGASTAQPSGDAEAIAALQAELEGLSGVGTRVDTVAGQIDGVAERVDAVAAQVDGLAARMDDLAATVAGLPAPPPDMSDRVAALEAELAALGQETQAVEISAEQLAREAAANQIRLAVDSGVPFAEPLAVLGDAPAVLAENAETGLPTNGELVAAFPDAARDALAEARRVEPGEGGLTGFIRRSTGARSLEPREGDDADAVLSRAEAAIRVGDVETALAEIDALPAVAQDAMADWIADARIRAAARAALPDYLGTE